MSRVGIIVGVAAIAAVASAAPAAELTALDLLRHELDAKIPAGWQLRVSRRDSGVVAFVTPPYQQAFDLWYAPEKLHAAVQSLCPMKESPVWKLIGAGESVIIVPTVGGKTADTMRVTCASDQR